MGTYEYSDIIFKNCKLYYYINPINHTDTDCYNIEDI